MSLPHVAPPGHYRRTIRTNRSRLILVAAVWIFLVTLFRLEYHRIAGLVSKSAPSIQYNEARYLRQIYTSTLKAAKPYKGNSTYFLCSGGRKGLQVIHTRFLLGQYRANATFVASRLLLLSTFFVDSLNAQSSQNFLVMVSYDARLPETAVSGLRSVISRLHAPAILHAENSAGRENNAALLTFSQLVPELIAGGYLPENATNEVDIYIMSRMDTDDAVHRGAVKAIQSLACSSKRTELYALQVAYVKAGFLWQPSNTSDAIHGSLAVQDPAPARYLAIMQSLVVAVRLGMDKCPVTVYSHQHMEPWKLQHIKLPDCPFVYSTSRNVHIWQPPNGEPGSLYVRTSSSSTRKKTKAEEEAWKPANVSMLVNAFGLDPSALAVTNMMFTGLEAEAQYTLIAKNAYRWR